MKRTLKQIAATIPVQFNRVGFNVETEQTDFVAIINFQTFEFHCGLFDCIPDKKSSQTWDGREGLSYSSLQRIVNEFKRGSYNYEGVYKAIREGRAIAIKNKDSWALEVWQRISAMWSPTAYDLIYFLRSDCEVTGMTFNQWCSEFGYDNDSIKARYTYDAYQQSIEKLTKAVGDKVFKEIMECEDID